MVWRWHGGRRDVGLDEASRAEGETGGSLSKFKVEALHKAARISWTVSEGLNGPITFEVHRSMSSPDAEYILVTSVEWTEGTQKYKYVDKKLPAEENYFYKVVILETNETYGPVQVRPPFSLPAT